MKLLMPSHARKIKLFKKEEALFQESGIEDQLSAMFNPVVPLPSGGYLVINPTEALVSVDVNSGRSTKEHSVEKTALKTNLEAATEIARQMRLRDLAGLLVIDFIDMDENRNNRAVERRIKDALKKDRARIQVGKISPFGLLELSRQRMRSGVLEGSSNHCSHCNGTGMVRSIESRALHVLRMIEQETVSLKDQDDKTIEVKVPREVAEYILNHKRTHLVTIEVNSGCHVVVSIDETLNEKVTSLAGVPSWMLVLLENVLRKTKKTSINEVWPFVEVYFHGGVSFRPYREQFEKLFSGNELNFFETYNASEGFFGIQDRNNSN